VDQIDIFDLAANVLYCPVCGANFSKNKIYVAGQVDDKFVIQTNCQSGHTPIQATLLVAFEHKGSHHPNVNYNDALDIKNALASHRGNFRQLISR